MKLSKTSFLLIHGSEGATCPPLWSMASDVSVYPCVHAESTCRYPCRFCMYLMSTFLSVHTKQPVTEFQLSSGRALSFSPLQTFTANTHTNPGVQMLLCNNSSAAIMLLVRAVFDKSRCQPWQRSTTLHTALRVESIYSICYACWNKQCKVLLSLKKEKQKENLNSSFSYSPVGKYLRSSGPSFNWLS